MSSTQFKLYSVILPYSTTSMKEEFRFVYKGVEYDATDYAEKHPGGLPFLKNMKAVTKDFTEYFRALHSDEAEKMLKSFKVVGTQQPSKSSEEYMQLYKKVEIYNEPLWSIEILLFLLMAATWVIGLTSPYTVFSMLGFSFTQILVGWVGHSASHNRNKKLNFFGRVQSALLGGFSVDWWTPKHNMHHMFTNITAYDQDIQHEYKAYLFPFLFLKWRFDSLVTVIQNKSWLDIFLILTNYACLYVYSANFWNFVIAALLCGFFTAFVLIGNHQKEVRFPLNPEMPFIDHQIVTCRNYTHQNLFWLLLMGGMQYQTEHHLFPQVPFYRLPSCKNLIKEELGRLNKSLIYGPVI